MSGDMNTFIDPYSTSTENGDPHAMHNGHDEMGSQSGSDEGSTVHYVDSFRNDGDFDDDPDALTSQTLNADGTPKRPMNAFMIFARKRRPQVSAENQAMRTGEISKILSKEWAMMPPSEKQFYLDRAKQLKETFNNKYPDYVYRRRPNNSRKKSKRRLDAGMGGAVDHRSTPEASEDFGNASCDYDSHREGEDRRYETGPGPIHRLQHDYIGATQPRSSPYAYLPSDSSYRHENPHEARVPLLPSQPERLPNDGPHRMSHSDIYNYVPTPSQSQPSQLYSASPAETHDRWDSRIGPGRCGWMHERSVPISTPRYAAGAASGWSGSVPATSTTTGSSAQPGSYAFPTLTSPFYPTQTQLQNYQATAPTSQPDSPARYESPANQGQQNTAGRDYDSQSYNPSPVTSASPYPDDSMIYQHRLAMPRGLPSVHSLASFSHSPHPGGSGTSAPQGY
jgi:hypothetical protein